MKFNELLGEKFEKLVKEDKEIIAVVIFGSFVTNREYSRDVDVCLILDKSYPNSYMTTKRLKFLSVMSGQFDITIFQQLPLYIKQRVLKDGKVILSKNDDVLYDIAYAMIKDYNLFEKIYLNYLNSVGEFVEVVK
ncbi:MAG: nucleotidyltransferase domain-containing protein [Nanoarchaeota archaeon]